MISDFSITSINGVEIKLHGLGPLNWVGRLVVVRRVRKITRQLLLKKFKQEMMKVVGQQSVVDMLFIHVLKRKFSRK